MPQSKEKYDPPQSLEASLDAQAEALAASFPGENIAAEAKVPKKSEHAEIRAHQEEIDKLVSKLPAGVRDQMREEFRANFTRIQSLDIEKSH